MSLGIDYLLPSVAESMSGSRLPTTTTDRGTIIVHGKKIFRAGTFKDSLGIEHTWTTDDLDKMVGHFHLLRTNAALVGVPLRVDHSFSARDLVGWISDVYRLGEFLYGDLHFTEWSAYVKWENGTYEPVSSEIAAYETNAGETFHPTLIGVAFVDIPAVEGLYRASGVKSERVTAVPSGTAMLDSGARGVYERHQEVPPMSTHSGQFDPKLAGLSTAQLSEHAQHSAALAGLEGLSADQIIALSKVDPTEMAKFTAAIAEPTLPAELEGLSEEDIKGLESYAALTDAERASLIVTDPPAPAANQLPAELEGVSPEEIVALSNANPEKLTLLATQLAASSHGAPVATATFRINGQPVTDPTLVQAHIDGMERQLTQTTESVRREYVTSLVRDQKITANQGQTLTELAVSMTPEQFSKFKEGYEGAPVSPLLGQFGAPAPGGAPANHAAAAPGAPSSSVATEIQTLEDIIARHRMAGKSEAEIQTTKSFRRLTELKTPAV